VRWGGLVAAEYANEDGRAYRDCKKRWIEERKEEKRKASAWW